MPISLVIKILRSCNKKCYLTNLGSLDKTNFSEKNKMTENQEEARLLPNVFIV